MTDLKEILKDKGVEFQETNNPTEILIKCTSGLHDDNHPSLHYNLDKNVFYCFSCGFRGGSLKFLESIGITQKLNIETKQEYKILKLKRKLQKIKNIDNIKLPGNMHKVTWDFNSINAEVLKEFNAFTTTDYTLEEYICIPVYQFGRLKFIDGRLRHSKAANKPRYVRRPAAVSVKDVMFPIDKIDKTNHIILVEGMYDMLKLWEHGIRNCLCIFGTQVFGKEKIDLLNKLNITKITLLLDGDKSGREASAKIKSLLERDNFIVNTIYLKPDEDPKQLSKEYLQWYLNNVGE